MDWNWYIFLGFLGGALFFTTAVWALQWAYKQGHMDKFEQGATVIFDDEEPMVPSRDKFPEKVRKKGKA